MKIRENEVSTVRERKKKMGSDGTYVGRRVMKMDVLYRVEKVKQR